MILFGPRPEGFDPDPFRHETTEHKCPECETHLILTLGSRMLTCSEGHGPFFLV